MDTYCETKNSDMYKER